MFFSIASTSMSTYVVNAETDTISGQSEAGEDVSEKENSFNASEITGTSSMDGVSVQVNAPSGTFPEGTRVQINPYGEAEASAYADGIDAANEGAVAFDVSFLNAAGEKVQPESGKEVNLTFTVDSSSDLVSSTGQLKVYHIGSGNDLLGTASVSDSGKEVSITVAATEFSPFVVMKTASSVSRNGGPLRAPAGYTPKEVAVVLGDLQITPMHGDGTDLYLQGGVDISFTWDAPNEIYDLNLFDGDYFVVTLPEELNYNSQGLTINAFDLTSSDGSIVYGRAVVDRENGTVTATFNENVENRTDVNGTMMFSARVWSASEMSPGTKTFTVSSGTSISTYDAEVKAPTGFNPDDHFLWKRSGFVTWGPDYDGENINQVQWSIHINGSENADYGEVVITDRLTGPNGSATTEKYVPGTFVLIGVDEFTSDTTYVRADDYTWDIIPILSLADDLQSFEIRIPAGGVPGVPTYSKFLIRYYTTFTYQAGYSLTNSVEVTTKEGTSTTTQTRAVMGSGTADGTIANRIRIVKVDAEDNSTGLSDAVFTITRPNGETFTLKTGSDGTVTSDWLAQGTYTIEEKTAPPGYDLNKETYTVTVGEDGVIQTIPNTRTKTTVSGEKIWNDNNDSAGLRPESITVNLLADGEQVDSKTVTPDASGNWKFSFTDIPKYNGTEEIEYTVTENSVDYYSVGITGDQANGFTITNTLETTEVSVTKVWDDEEFANVEGYERPTSVTVRLLADGSETDKTATLNATNGWTTTFTDLAKKNASGQDISYTVEETNIPAGFSASVEGSAANGYTIKNTPIDGEEITPVSLIINKIDGAEGAGQTVLSGAEFGVYTDQQGTDSVGTISESNGGYTFTFRNEGTYYIKETTAPTGYKLSDTVYAVTVSKSGIDRVQRVESVWMKIYHLFFSDGSSLNGNTLTIPNESETTEVSGTKTWNDGNDQDGKRPATITVNLLADETPVDSTTVRADANGDWTYSFTNLPKYANGEKIVYSITEDSVEGYDSTVTGYNVTNTIKISESGFATFSIQKYRTDSTIPVADAIFALSDGQTATTDENGIATFSYEFTDEAGPVELTLTEISAPAGYTKSDAIWTVTLTRDGVVSVTLNNNVFEKIWNWIVGVSPDDSFVDGVLTVYNDYSAEYDLELEASKVLTGRDMTEGEFTFTVKEDEETVTTGINTADGIIVFDNIHYTAEDVGRHIYIITEDLGQAGGVTYDTNSFTVFVEVFDNGDGTLSVETSYPEDGVIFENSYQPAETTVTLEAKKNYTGSTLKKDQFSFELKDEDGNVIETVKNAEDGTISFSELTFTEVGEYTYTISEVKGNETGVTYDTTVYKVKITVTDDGQGNLVATVDTEEKDLIFNNTYTPESKTPSNSSNNNGSKTSSGTPSSSSVRSSTPKTGDESNMGLWIGLMAAAVFGITTVSISRKRKNADN